MARSQLVIDMPLPAPEIHEGVPPPRSLRKTVRNSAPPDRHHGVEQTRHLNHSPAAATDTNDGCPDWETFVLAERRNTVDPLHLYDQAVQYH